MKKRILLFSMSVIMAGGLLVGCAGDQNKDEANGPTTDEQAALLEPLKVESSDIPGTITYEDNEFTASLEENATTGYTWVYTSDSEIVTILSDEYKTDASEDDEAVGVGGLREMKFLCIAPGETTMTFELKQDWEGGEVDSTFSLKVTAEEDGFIKSVEEVAPAA